MTTMPDWLDLYNQAIAPPSPDPAPNLTMMAPVPQGVNTRAPLVASQLMMPAIPTQQQQYSPQLPQPIPSMPMPQSLSLPQQLPQQAYQNPLYNPARQQAIMSSLNNMIGNTVEPRTPWEKRGDIATSLLSMVALPIAGHMGAGALGGAVDELHRIQDQQQERQREYERRRESSVAGLGMMMDALDKSGPYTQQNFNNMLSANKQYMETAKFNQDAINQAMLQQQHQVNMQNEQHRRAREPVEEALGDRSKQANIQSVEQSTREAQQRGAREAEQAAYNKTQRPTEEEYKKLQTQQLQAQVQKYSDDAKMAYSKLLADTHSKAHQAELAFVHSLPPEFAKSQGEIDAHLGVVKRAIKSGADPQIAYTKYLNQLAVMKAAKDKRVKDEAKNGPAKSAAQALGADDNE